MTHITIPRELLEHAIWALEYHRAQTRPVHESTEAANALRAALDQGEITDPSSWRDIKTAPKDASIICADGSHVAVGELAWRYFAPGTVQQAETAEPVAWMYEHQPPRSSSGIGGWDKHLLFCRPAESKFTRNIRPLYASPVAQQPQEPKCPACEGRPAAENSPCAVCGKGQEPRTAALVQAETAAPVAWMYQHDETGHIGFVDAQQVEWGFQKANPRLLLIAPLYRAPVAQQPQEQGEVVVTRDESGAIVAVTRQDSEGRIIKVIAETQERKPLTEEQIIEIRRTGRYIDITKPWADTIAFARAIEAAHGIGEEGK